MATIGARHDHVPGESSDSNPGEFPGLGHTGSLEPTVDTFPPKIGGGLRIRRITRHPHQAVSCAKLVIVGLRAFRIYLSPTAGSQFARLRNGVGKTTESTKTTSLDVGEQSSMEPRQDSPRSYRKAMD